MSDESFPKVTSSLELHGAAASSSPHSVLYLPGKVQSILYASNCILNIATPVSLDNEADDSGVVYNVQTTLRTQTLPRTDWIRSITALALLRPAAASDDVNNAISDGKKYPCIVVCAFSDGSITLWNQQSDNSWVEHVVTGLTSTGEVFEQNNNPQKEKSISDIDGVYYCPSTAGTDEQSPQIVLMVASANGVQSYRCSIDLESNVVKEITTSVVATYPTSTIKFTTMDNQLLLAAGSALPRNNRIHFYTQPIGDGTTLSSSSPSLLWKHQGSVIGHLDWISCLDWSWSSIFNGAGMLASGSQDAKIRLWKFHQSMPYDEDETMNESGSNSDSEGEEEDDGDEEDDEDLIEEGEARMHIRYENFNGINVQSAVTLEALLIGHEEHVTSVAWRPNSKAPCLISSSMDRCILIWMEEEEDQTNATASAMSEGSGNIWVPVTRVGTAGGVLGGSIGSSLLGFINVLWSDDGKRIVGHGFGGAIYFWSSSYKTSSGVVSRDSVERWLATPGITGHFRGCSDISWEASRGMYLLSGGLDQTCRLWMQVPTLCPKSYIWKEVGRPQVHGYDLNTVTCIGSGKGELIHRFVSGADEKEARAFDAPKETMNLICRLWGKDGEDVIMDNGEERVQRAFIPSLGLSNRANVSDAMEEREEVGITKDQSPEIDSKYGEGIEESIAKSLPRERDLGVASLWPEIRKLYGHLTEIVCLASNAGTSDIDVLVASSCKARDSENAAIRVWNVNKNACVDILKVSESEIIVMTNQNTALKLTID